MTKLSAGILLFQRDPLQVLLVHPGGPFWARKDMGAWSIPKGEYDDGEDAEAAGLGPHRLQPGLTHALLDELPDALALGRRATIRADAEKEMSFGAGHTGLGESCLDGFVHRRAS